ncbi:11128_t:CDS:2 [Ambispora leptoticha]|uniref:11128_t:CDS:1 n=1 Tax=Ambispora leptoticha TaxID=144679 RepID=A0A9N8YW85_9GLOM|nr:11128_t:CDS:2 [Ambispora leptoticha]
MDEAVSYQFAQVKQRRDGRHEIDYELILRQQPKQSRMCGIGEKADRRPIDPPPIIQLKVYDANIAQTEKSNSFLQNPYFFMYASLVASDSDEELHLLRDKKTRSTTGSVVSSLYHLKDIDNSDAGFFVFPDLSVRMEGTYRLKLSLFEIIGHGPPRREVFHCKSIFSDVFTVYSAKRFPGMEESTFLSRSFADQGLKIRIRKEIRIRRRIQKRKEIEPAENAESSQAKRPRGEGDAEEDTESTDEDMHEQPSPEDSQLKIITETSSSNEKKMKEQSSHNSPSPRARGPYDHMPPPHPYDPAAAMYGAGYGRPHPWHDRDYMGEHPPPHYPPYYDPYERHYMYNPYPYYPPIPPITEGSEHHRYPYPHHLYARPPMYTNYYDSSRIQHSTSDSPNNSKSPYPYDATNPYSGYPRVPGPWAHYGERSSSKEDPTLPRFRAAGPLTSRPVPAMYPYHPEYYGPAYLPPLPLSMPPHGSPTKTEYGNQSNEHNFGVSPGSSMPAKIPIQNLIESPENSSQNNDHSITNSKSSPRSYGPPPAGYIHPHPHYAPSRMPDYPPQYPPRMPYESSYSIPSEFPSHYLYHAPTKNTTSTRKSPNKKSSLSPQLSSETPAKHIEESSVTNMASSGSDPQQQNEMPSRQVGSKQGTVEYGTGNPFDSSNRQGFQGETFPVNPEASTSTSTPYSNTLIPSARRQSVPIPSLNPLSLNDHPVTGTPTGSTTPIRGSLNANNTPTHMSTSNISSNTSGGNPSTFGLDSSLSSRRLDIIDTDKNSVKMIDSLQRVKWKNTHMKNGDFDGVRKNQKHYILKKNFL